MTGEHPPLVELDLWLLGEATADEAARCDAHVKSCATCAARAAGRRDSMDAFRRSVLPKGLPARVRRRRWWTWAWPAAVAAAATVAAIAVMPRGRAPAEAPYGVKGGASLRVYVNKDGEGAPLSDVARLRAGDAIRFVVDPAGASHLLLVGVDAAGTSTVYYPFAGKQSARLPGPGRFTVPGSIVLDDAPGPERLWALLSREALAADAIQEQATKIAARGASSIRATTRLPVEAEQATFLIEKPSR